MIASLAVITLSSIEEVKQGREETFKVFANQWYWAYESPMLEEFRAYLGEGVRMWDTDLSLVLPSLVEIRARVTSRDVLHAWALPRYGLKVDATAGRLCSLRFSSKTRGKHYGQCSELCGVNHSFMPVSVEIVPAKVYSK